MESVWALNKQNPVEHTVLQSICIQVDQTHKILALLQAVNKF